jgi:hypothetical protein
MKHIISLGAGAKVKWQNYSLEERFWCRVSKQENGCWLWIGAKSANGYGQIAHKKTTIGAHRLSYKLHKGEIPAGLVIDHLCRNRSCVNPDHLEAVNQRTNTMRGESPSVKQHNKGFCKNGHPMTPENRDSKRRRCRVCLREDVSRRYWAKKENSKNETN